MENELKDRLNHIELSLKIAVFISNNDSKDLKCIGSTVIDYKKWDKSSLYKHFLLIKVLGIKSDLWTKELKEDLYNNENKTTILTMILEWKKDLRAFCYIYIENDQEYEQIASNRKNKP